MSRIEWGATGQRFFETGVDRGVLYLPSAIGVPWDGIRSITESPTGGEARPFYFEGFKFANVASAEDYEATLVAVSRPDEFMACDGTVSISNGLFVTQQPRAVFNLSYRTLIGNDVAARDLGYKIHIVYNALAAPVQRAYNTVSDSPEVMELSWNITTRPPLIDTYKPTAHLVVDSRYTESSLLSDFEDILYGTSELEPELPSIQDIFTLFS